MFLSHGNNRLFYFSSPTTLDYVYTIHAFIGLRCLQPARHPINKPGAFAHPHPPSPPLWRRGVSVGPSGSGRLWRSRSRCTFVIAPSADGRRAPPSAPPPYSRASSSLRPSCCLATRESFFVAGLFLPPYLPTYPPLKVASRSDRLGLHNPIISS